MSESSSQATASSPRTSPPSSGRGGSSRGAIKRSRAKVLPTSASDVLVLLSDGLRDQDLAELAALGRDPAQALWQAVGASGALVFTIHVDGRPAGIFGACPTEEVDVGGAWMLGTVALLAVRRELIVEAPHWINFLHRVYPTLTNYVDDRNDVSVRWLEAMGFEFPFVDDFATPDGVIFRRFYRCVTPSPSPQ